MATPYTTAKASGENLDRFACCFMHTEGGVVNWEAAAADFDPKVKVASFRTQVQRAMKKITGGEGGTAAGSEKKTKENGGGKRKKAVAGAGDDEEVETPKAKKAKGGPKGKKVTGGFTPINGVQEDGEGDEDAAGEESPMKAEQQED